MKQSAAQNKDETFAMTQLTELTTLFERNKKQYTSVYDEANTRTDFIDKFLNFWVGTYGMSKVIPSNIGKWCVKTR